MKFCYGEHKIIQLITKTRSYIINSHVKSNLVMRHVHPFEKKQKKKYSKEATVILRTRKEEKTSSFER